MTTAGELLAQQEGYAKPASGGSSSKSPGTFFGIPMPNLGVPELIHGIAGSLTGIEHAALSAVTGDFHPAAEMGKGIASSFVGTGLNALDVGSLGLLHGATDSLRDEWGNILGGPQYAPQSLMEQYNQGGILTPLVQNIGNVAGVAGGLSSLASAGDVGLAGSAALTASKAAEAGFTPADIASAADAAKSLAAGTKTAFQEAGIEHPALQAAGQAAAKAEGLNVAPEVAATRAKLLGVLEDVAHPYKSLFSEVVSPLGRAATARLGTETAAAGEGAVLAGATQEADTFANPAVPAPEPPVAPGATQAVSERVSAGSTPAGPAATAPSGGAGISPSPSYPTADALKQSLADAVAAAKPEDVAAAAASKAVDAKRAAALKGVAPGDRVTLYHGEPGAFDPQSTAIPTHWTPDVTEAQTHAGEGGHVLETVVPKDVAAAAQAHGVLAGHFGAEGTGSHILPPEWSGLAKPTEIPGKAAVEVANTPGLLVSPAARATARAAQEAGATPAEAVAEALRAHPAAEPPPSVIAEALKQPSAEAARVAAPGVESNTLGLTNLHGKGPIEDAMNRARNAPIADWAKTAVDHLPSPVVHALSKVDRFTSARETGMVLRERIRMQDINRREIANSDAFRVPAAAGSKFLYGRVLPDGTKITADLADKLMGDELIARLEHVSAVEDAVARHATPTAMEAMRQTLVRAGERAGQSIPTEWLRDANGARTALGNVIDNAVEGLRQAATEKSAIMRGTSEKGLEHIAESLPGLSASGKKTMQSVADDLKQIKRLEQSKIPTERARAAIEMARVRDELQKVSTELAATHAAARTASEKFDLTRIPKNASDEYLKSNAPGISKALGFDHTLEPDALRTALSPKQRMMSTPDVAGLSPHEMYRRGVEGATQSEAIRQAAQKAADLESHRVALQKNLDDMKTSFTQSEVVAQRLRAGIEPKLDRVAREMSNPAMSQVPAHWKPVWDSITSLHDQALAEAKAGRPELAQALADGHIAKNWQTVLRVAADEGFDPVHVRSFTTSQVKNLVYDSVSLGKKGRDLGQTIEAGTRKNRLQAATRTRSLSALDAGVAEATHEMHSNALATFLHDTYAKPVENGALRPGYAGWDAERSFLLTGEKDSMGNTIVHGLGAPQWQVPKEVIGVLHAYQKDYSHGIFNSIRTVTQPWKLLMLTLHPTWYVNHVLGHIIMASKEGVSIGDWIKAWHAFREGGADMTRGAVMQHLGAGAESFGNESGAIAGGLRSELTGSNSMVPIPRGVRGLNDVRKSEGVTAAGNVALSRLARPATVVDELSRAATYFHGLRKGMTEAQALNRTYHALIDFTDLSPFERGVVKSVVPFYSFQKGMLKVVAKMPLDHPAVTSILLSLGKTNSDLMKAQFGADLPSYYQNFLPVPGLGWEPAKALNPFADADTLTSPQGIAGSMNPFVGIVLRNALGAPASAHPEFTKVNQFGQAMPDTSPAQDLGQLLGKLPQVKAVEGATGTQLPGQYVKPGTNGSPSLGDTLAGFALPSNKSAADLSAIAAKVAAPAAKKAAAAKKPPTAASIIKAAVKRIKGA